MLGDITKTSLHAMFAELRRLKQEELPRRFEDPVEQARHDMRVREAIRRAEEKIERVMSDENS